MGISDGYTITDPEDVMQHQLFRTPTLKQKLVLTAIVTGVTLSACTSASRKQQGAVIGAAAGGVAGAVIGKNNNGTAKGAILGAAVGGTIGAIIGHQMDQQAKKIEQQIPGAVVERVGEGIQVTFASGLLFGFDSDRVSSEAAVNLRNLAQSLNENRGTDLLIVGHTDNVGDDPYNQRLSERRAQATADYLASQEVDRTRLRSSGRGEAEPVTENSTVEGQQRNRRVEVAIFASEAYKNELRRKSGL